MQKFDTAAPVSVVLDIVAGSIRFVATDRADTRVDVRPADAAKGCDVAAAQQIDVAYYAGVLWIQDPPARHRILGDTGSVTVTVEVPAGSHVDAQTACAEFDGVGRLGDVTIDNAAGSVTLDEAASARLTLQAGDVTIGRLGGLAEISTRMGDIDITEAVGSTVVLHTDHGQVSIGAAAGVAATLDAGTGHGRIHSTLNSAGSATRLTIHATTTFGDIIARSL